MDDEVTAAQAAQLTGLSERTIRRRIAAHTIPARHVARNRYAIRVSDLPIRQPADEVMARLQALEYRVHVLELLQARVLSHLDPALSSTATSARDVSGEVGEASADAGTGAEVSDLLAQLVREVRRLAPIISAAMPEAPARRASQRRLRPGQAEDAAREKTAEG